MTRLACFLMVCLSLLAACGENGAQSSRVDEPAPLDPTMLGQDQPALRETGFEQISKLETADALALILSKLHHEPDDALIRRVRSWLLGLPAQRLKSVIPYVRKTTHAQVRVMLAVAMAGHPSLRGELLRMCQDPDMQVRRQAALALGQQAPVALLEDKAPEVRILVAELLGRTADGESDWRVQLAVDRKNSRIGAEALPPTGP